MQITLGLTGGIASGKSTIANMFKDKGVPVIDTDIIARQVVEKGTVGLEQITQTFGKEILNEDGTLNRKKLGSIIFQDAHQRDSLNKIMQPLIQEEMIKQRDVYLANNERIVVLDIPLLYEGNLEHTVNQILVVYVDKETQLKRLMDRNKLTEKEARDRISSQLPLEKKKERADLIIDNTGDLDASREQFEKLFAKLI